MATDVDPVEKPEGGPPRIHVNGRPRELEAPCTVAEIVTVALRRIELKPGQPSLLDAIDPKRYALLPNTAGCYTAAEAIRTAHLARELGMTDFVKLEVIGDKRTLFPDAEETLAAAR